MKRSAEKHLFHWFARETAKPLIIRGARQVGKSTLVRQFASNQRLGLFEINLEKHPQLNSVFARLNVDDIIQEMEIVSGKKGVLASDSLLFLDEIQACPQAIPALRYLHEGHPSLKIIGAGSLLEFALTRHNFSMPVGRIEYLYLGPMTFEEFLEAGPDADSLEYLLNFRLEENFSPTAHDRLSRALRRFLVCGGMPEVVDALRTGSEEDAFRIHAAITETYRDDFAKYATRDELVRLQRLFGAMPRLVGRKLKYVNVDPDMRAAQVRAAVDLLAMAQVIALVFHSDCSGLPLGAGRREDVCKPLFLDVGLLNHMAGIRRIPAAEFQEERFVNEGQMAEQFIGQHLLYAADHETRPALHYWLKEARQNNAEVDYVIQSDSRIVPVEVKAGKSGRLKSLIEFVHRKQVPLAVRFDLNFPSRQVVEHKLTGDPGVAVRFPLISLPLYLVGQLPRLIREAREISGA